MKRNLVITFAVGVFASSALAQGLISFTTAPYYIQYGGELPYQKVPVGNPAEVPGVGRFNLTLYGAPAGTTLSLVGGLPDLTGPWKPAAWIVGQTSGVLHDIGPEDGTVSGHTFQMEPSVVNAAGELQLTVVAWTGDYGSFGEAAKGGGFLAWTGDVLSGGALSWRAGSGGPLTAPYPIDKGPNAFNGLVFSVPEPSALALGGLGCAAWLISCGRKGQRAHPDTAPVRMSRPRSAGMLPASRARRTLDHQRLTFA